MPMKTKEYVRCVLPSWSFPGKTLSASDSTAALGGHTNTIREEYCKTAWMQISESGEIVDFAVNDNPL